MKKNRLLNIQDANNRDLAALLRRAAAAIETPGDCTTRELTELAEDLLAEATLLSPED